MFKRDAQSGFPREPRSMRPADYGLLLSIVGIFAVSICVAQVTKPAPLTSDPSSELSGMYSFEREGEFVQISVEQRTAKSDKTKPLAVTGFISRYGDSDSDRGAFLDYFITKGSLDGGKISFVTKPVHGISYEFMGTVARGKTETRDKDGYYELRGTLTQNIVEQDKVTSAKSREITMKLFPDLDREPAKIK